jgi:hypothetical protein
MVGTILGNEINPNTKIYRIFTKERLYQMFKSHQNALVRPRLWEDTFENLALNSEIEVNGETAKFGFKDDIYGQCWTLHTVSDAMWRLYSKGTDGVRIRTTVGKLIDSLSISEPKHAGMSCFIGKVRYQNNKDLVKFADTHFANGIGTNGVKIAETLLIKRKAFEHEKEVRLVYLSPETSPPDKDLYCYKLDPNKLLDQIMIHPQMNSSDAEVLKNEIITTTGYNGVIKRSLLYRLPRGFKFKVNA